MSLAQSASKPAGSGKLRFSADHLLFGATRLWYVVTTLGLWYFGVYIVSFYSKSFVAMDFTLWNKVLAFGYIPGDLLGNLAVASHVILAAIIAIFGPLQLVPQIRKHAPKFHRVNGRAFLFAAVLTSLGGLYLNLARGALSGPIASSGVNLNAVVTVIFAFLALRYAMKRDIETHQRYALRLFIVVAGVWYFRIGMSIWLTTMGPVGFDPSTFRGPVINILNYLQFLFPLAMLELTQWALRKGSPAAKAAMAALLFGLTVLLAYGIVMAGFIFWLPNI